MRNMSLLQTICLKTFTGTYIFLYALGHTVCVVLDIGTLTISSVIEINSDEDEPPQYSLKICDE